MVRLGFILEVLFLKRSYFPFSRKLVKGKGELEIEENVLGLLLCFPCLSLSASVGENTSIQYLSQKTSVTKSVGVSPTSSQSCSGYQLRIQFKLTLSTWS